MRFKNLAIIAKIALMFAVTDIAAVACIAGLSYEMKSTVSSFDDLMHGQMAARKNLQSANREVVWVERSIIQNIWATSDADNAKFRADTKAGEVAFREAIQSAISAFPPGEGTFRGFLRSFDEVIGTNCAKAIDMGNAATTLDGDGKAFVEMNASCEPVLNKLSVDINSALKGLIDDTEKTITATVAKSDFAIVASLVSAGVALIAVLVVVLYLMHTTITTPIRVIG